MKHNINKKIKSHKAIYGLLVLFSFALSLYLFFGKTKSDKESYFYQQVDQFLKSGKKEISVKDLTNFNWHEVCYVWPYGGVSDMKISKFKLNKKIPEDDSQDYLVFLNSVNMTGIVIYMKAGVVSTEVSNIKEDKEYDGCSNLENAVIRAIDNSRFLLTTNNKKL